MMRSEHYYSSEILHFMLSDKRNKANFLYLKFILNEFRNVNLIFQADNSDPTKLTGFVYDVTVQRLYTVHKQCSKNVYEIRNYKNMTLSPK